eukprot:987644-Amphidinium_carterae.1
MAELQQKLTNGHLADEEHDVKRLICPYCGFVSEDADEERKHHRDCEHRPARKTPKKRPASATSATPATLKRPAAAPARVEEKVQLPMLIPPALQPTISKSWRGC